MLSCASEESFLGTRDLDIAITQPVQSQAARSTKRDIESILSLYNLAAMMSTNIRQEFTPVFVYRMVHLSMEHGVSKYSILGCLLYSTIICNSSSMEADVQMACRIAKLAISALKKLDWYYSVLGHAAVGFYYCFV